MTFKVLGTNHTSFTVLNLDRTVGFFRDCLGFELVSKAPRDPALVSRITGVEGAVKARPVSIDQGPNKGRRVVYVRDGVTLEFIEAVAR